MSGFLEGFAGGIGMMQSYNPTPGSWLSKPFGQQEEQQSPDMPKVPNSPVPADALSTQFPKASKIAEALAQIESGGNYNAVGPTVKGKNAYGKYQIMEQNVPSWGKAATGQEVTLNQFKTDKSLQDRIALYKIQGYLDQGYSPQDIASLWLSGRPLSGNQRRDLATGISVPDYVERFNKYYAQS